ncbi:hypothetical protein B0H34DRAFT_424663 [Crassisporium funariophilum]|nr:hypothetical protein B0H34DRAFT_424663 [Crassisporium funariophilum]
MGHFETVALIMPSTASGTHVFFQMQDSAPQASEDNEDDDSQLIPWETSPAPQAAAPPSLDSDNKETPPQHMSAPQKRAWEPATPTRPSTKRVRGSKNATALESLSCLFSEFGTTIAKAFNGPPSSQIDPTPVCRTTAIKSLVELKKGWLSKDDLVTLIDFLRADATAADTYITLIKSDNVCHAWVCTQLRKLNALFLL